MLHNNIFFTVDEGRDAVYVREILNYHKIFTKGPESSVAGVFAGPLWYYFISIGYAVMHGNPIGSVFGLILLNLFVTTILIFVIGKRVGIKVALIVGFGLQIFWPFFMTSLWGFNPFPLVALSIFLILILEKFLEKPNSKTYALGLVPILLGFNTELAGTFAFLIFYILFGVWAVRKKKLNWRDLFIFGLAIPILGGLKILNDFANQPIGSKVNSGLGVFAGLNFVAIAQEFVKMIGGAVIPQLPIIGFLIAVLIILVFIFFTKSKNKFVKNFSYLTFVLVFVSYLFFSSNQGWRSWHTVYISPLILTTMLLICFELSKASYSVVKKTGKVFIVIILFLQILFFKQNYIDYLKPSDNSSLLSNQMGVLDWIYTNSEGNGFNAYTYTNTFYDYPYQYLFTWYGGSKYGFLPCEYSNFPFSHKELYVPGWEHYTEPKLGCDKFRFLIIESDTNGEDNKNWIDEFRIENHFVARTKIGDTVIEKYKARDIY